jgi:hypothetical protein
MEQQRLRLTRPTSAATEKWLCEITAIWHTAL